MPDKQEVSIPRLFHSYRSPDRLSGSWRLFPRALGGFFGMRHHWFQQSPNWSRRDTWNILHLVTVSRVTPGEIVGQLQPGWYINFATVSVQKAANGFAIIFTAAPSGYSY